MRSTPASTSCSGRSTPGACATTASATAAAAASRPRAWSTPPPPTSGVPVERCVVVGDIGADVEAARRAGARGDPGPDPGHPARRDRRRRRRRGRPRRGRRPADRTARGERRRAPWSCASTTSATSCSPVRRSGPCAASGLDVTVLCGPNGRAAAELLPGVDDVWEFRAPWIDPDRHPVVPAGDRRAGHPGRRRAASSRRSSSPASTSRRCRRRCCCGWPACRRSPATARTSRARCSTSAIARRTTCTRSSATCRSSATLGHRLPAGRRRRACVSASTVRPSPAPFAEPYVVVHPGASVPARAWSPDANRAAVDALVDAGWRVAVTGGAERARRSRPHVAGPPRGRRRRPRRGDGPRRPGDGHRRRRRDRGRQHRRRPRRRRGRARPSCRSTRPTVPAERWRPWRVPHVLLGDQDIGCRHCRARSCPVAGPSVPGVDRTRRVVAAVADARRRRVPVEPSRRARRERLPLARPRVLDDGVRPGPPPLPPARRRRPLAVGPRPGPDLGLAADHGRGRRSTARDAAASTSSSCNGPRSSTASPSSGSAAVARAVTSPPSTWSTTRRRDASPRWSIPPPTGPTSTVVHVTHFNDLFWDCGSTPTVVIEHGIVDPGHRATPASWPARRS